MSTVDLFVTTHVKTPVTMQETPKFISRHQFLGYPGAIMVEWEGKTGILMNDSGSKTPSISSPAVCILENSWLFHSFMTFNFWILFPFISAFKPAKSYLNNLILVITQPIAANTVVHSHSSRTLPESFSLSWHTVPFKVVINKSLA